MFRRDPDATDAAAPSETPAQQSPAPDANAAGAAELSAEVVGLLTRLQTEKDELSAKYDTVLRRYADLDNARKRIERDRQDDAIRSTATVIEAVLPALDAFEHALAAHNDPTYEDYRKGFELIYRQMLEALGRFGLERMETRGKHFDPHVHQAVERVETSEFEEGTVLGELRGGYRLRDRVLRPALVRVAVKPAAEPAEADGDSE